MKLPSLDELEGFENQKDIDENTKEFEDLLSEFENGDLTINEQEYDEMIVDDDDFSKVDKVNTYVDDEFENSPIKHSESSYNEKSDYNDIQSNHLDEETNLEQNTFIEESENEISPNLEYEEEIDDYEEISEDDVYEESDENFSFLPSVNDDDEKEEEKDELDENLKSNKNNDENDLDEKAKVFFMTLKNKIFNLLKKDKKEDSFNKLNKNNDNKKLNKRNLLNFKMLNKKVKVLILIMLIIAISIGTFYFIKNKNMKDLNEMNYTYKENDSLVVLQDFKHNENELTLKAKNEGEISESLSMQLFFENGKDEKITCESDIIHLESGETSDLSLSCTNTFKNEKYKLSTSIESYK